MKKLQDILNRARTPRGIWTIVGALVVLWVVVGLFAPGVEVVRAQKGAAIEAVTGTLRVTALEEVAVRAQVGGRLLSLRKLGPSGKLPLEAGEVFAVLDTAELDREIDYYKGRQKFLKDQIGVGSDREIEIANARTDLNMAESLYRSGQFSLNDLEKKRRDVERLERSWQKEYLGLERSLADATYELQLRQDRRERMVLKSPFKGDLCALFAFEGQTVPPEAPVGLVRSQQLQIEVSLSEEDFPGLAVGQRVTLSFTGIPNDFSGRVSSLAAYSNPDTRRRSAFVQLDKPAELIVPGSTGYATIIKAERPNALILPRRALMGDSVYALEWGYLRRKKVKVGYQSFSTVEILDGLWNGTAVALAGAQEILDGERVRANWVKQ